MASNDQLKRSRSQLELAAVEDSVRVSDHPEQGGGEAPVTKITKATPELGGEEASLNAGMQADDANAPAYLDGAKEDEEVRGDAQAVDGGNDAAKTQVQEQHQEQEEEQEEEQEQEPEQEPAQAQADTASEGQGGKEEGDGDDDYEPQDDDHEEHDEEFADEHAEVEAAYENDTNDDYPPKHSPAPMACRSMRAASAWARLSPTSMATRGVTTKRAGNAKAMADISNRCLSDLPVSQFSHSARNAC
jgi:hypothetical protein